MALLARIEQQSHEERGHQRFRLRLGSSGPDEAGGGTVTICELSSSGFLIETDAPLGVGAEVAFLLPVAGNVAGEIVWSSGGYHGGQFRTPLPTEALSATLAASRVVWPNFTRSSAAHRGARAEPPQASLWQAAAAEIGSPPLPLSSRFHIIAGVSLLLWSLIGAATWLVVQAVR